MHGEAPTASAWVIALGALAGLRAHAGSEIEAATLRGSAVDHLAGVGHGATVLASRPELLVVESGRTVAGAVSAVRSLVELFCFGVFDIGGYS